MTFVSDFVELTRLTSTTMFLSLYLCCVFLVSQLLGALIYMGLSFGHVCLGQRLVDKKVEEIVGM